MTIGCKILTKDLRSPWATDHGGTVVQYSREWTTVPSFGSFVAINGGLVSGGKVPVDGRLVYLECEEPHIPACKYDTQCFYKVRIIDDCPDKITPKLRGEIARHAPRLTPFERFKLAIESTPTWRGKVAAEVEGLTGEQRFQLAMESDPYFRGLVAHVAVELTPDHRFTLLLHSSEKWRREVVRWDETITTRERRILFRSLEEKGRRF